MFKVIGVIAGFYFYGFFGLIAGYFLGSIVDRYIAYGPGGVNPISNGQRQAVFLETVFMLMGKVAKADGLITQDEISHVEQFMQNLGMTAEHRQAAIALFKQGAAPEFDTEVTVKRFMSVCGHTQNLKQMLLIYLIVMALSDGRMDATEEHLLSTVALQLGYDQQAFKYIFEMVLNQSHFAGGQTNSANALEDAYKALGVGKDSSDQEVKRAYRKLMSQYHPDKLMGQGLPPDMIAVATEKAQEVQVAYDLILKNRKP